VGAVWRASTVAGLPRATGGHPGRRCRSKGVVRPGPGYTPCVQRAEAEVGLTMSDVTTPGRLRGLLERL
jgi:hypothetical protein